MRRTFFGGISLGLGLFANTAAAQDAKYPPLGRVAKLGAPSALPDASPPVTRAATPDEEVTPVGLRSRVFGTPVSSATGAGRARSSSRLREG